MTAADRVLMLDVLFDVHVGIHPDGARLLITGPADTIAAATPALRLYKQELLAHLRRTAATAGTGQ